MEVYLDNSATTKPREEVVAIMNEAFKKYYGNPSSLHAKGVEVERLIKAARRNVASLINASEDEIYFTSGGTEANNLAIYGALKGNKRKGRHIITSKIEHPSVLNVCKDLENQGYEVDYLNVDKYGVIDLEEFKRVLREDTAIVSLMYVNNEVGSIQPIKDVIKIISRRENKPIVHVDAIQAVGKIDIDLKRLKADILTLSGHKFHGPKGIGAIFIRKGVKIMPIILGGNQEYGFRSGTENVPGILGLGEAARLLKEEFRETIERMAKIKEKLYRGIESNIQDIKFNTLLGENFSPHILNVSFLGVKGEVLLHTLEKRGIYVSTGSACSSKKKDYSHVLSAMGLKDRELESAIRFSFNPFITEEEIDYTIKVLKESVEELRKVTAGR